MEPSFTALLFSEWLPLLNCQELIYASADMCCFQVLVLSMSQMDTGQWTCFHWDYSVHNLDSSLPHKALWRFSQHPTIGGGHSEFYLFRRLINQGCMVSGEAGMSTQWNPWKKRLQNPANTKPTFPLVLWFICFYFYMQRFVAFPILKDQWYYCKYKNKYKSTSGNKRKQLKIQQEHYKNTKTVLLDLDQHPTYRVASYPAVFMSWSVWTWRKLTLSWALPLPAFDL